MESNDINEFKQRFLSELNVDCVLKLFEYFDVYDLMKIASFNDRLATLASYRLRKVKCKHDRLLVFRKTIENTVLCMQDMTRTLHYMEIDLKNVGHLIKVIDLSTVFNCSSPANSETQHSLRFTQRYLNLVKEYCTGLNLEHLKLSSLNFPDNIHNYRLLLSQLTSLTLNRILISEQNISEMVNVCERLTKLDIQDIKITGTCLRQVRSPMRAIRLQLTGRQCTIERDHLLHFLFKHPGLIEICLNELILRRILPEAYDSYRSVERIELDGTGMRQKYKDIDGELLNALQPIKLTSMTIANHVINPAVMYNLERYKNLEWLSFSENMEDDLDDNSWEELIANLPSLKHFHYNASATMEITEARFLRIVRAGTALRTFSSGFEASLTPDIYLKVVEIVMGRLVFVPLQIFYDHINYNLFKTLLTEFGSIVDLNNHLILE